MEGRRLRLGDYLFPGDRGKAFEVFGESWKGFSFYCVAKDLVRPYMAMCVESSYLFTISLGARRKLMVMVVRRRARCRNNFAA